jgi:hypothetical protein
MTSYNLVISGLWGPSNYEPIITSQRFNLLNQWYSYKMVYECNYDSWLLKQLILAPHGLTPRKKTAISRGPKFFPSFILVGGFNQPL